MVEERSTKDLNIYSCLLTGIFYVNNGLSKYSYFMSTNILTFVSLLTAHSTKLI